MRRVIFILGLSVFLVGCDKAVEDKTIAELTSDEAESICKVPDVLDQLTNNFKANTNDFLIKSPLRYYPWIEVARNDYKGMTDVENRRKSRVDESYIYTAETFNKGFGGADVLKVDNPTLSGTGKDSLTCSATLVFVSDELYGKSFSAPISYNVIKENNKFITGTKKSLNEMEQRKTEPTASQKEWRSKLEAELKSKDDALRNLADSEYQPISENDLFYIYFSQTPRQFSDDELMGLFSPKWNNTSDTFAKEDIKKTELPQIKSKIAEYKNIKDILVYSTSESTYKSEGQYKMKTKDGQDAIKINDMGIFITTGDSYDVSKKGFEYHNFLCSMNGGITVQERGVALSVGETLRGCTLSVPDEKAREISAKFATLHSNGKNVDTLAKYYIHIDNIDGDRNTVNAILVKDSVQLIDPETKEVILDTVVK